MKIFLPFFFLFAFFTTGFSQITLTADDVMNLLGTSYTVATDTVDERITVDAGPAGEDQIWDFQNLSFPSFESTYEFISPGGTPFFDAYPQANLTQKSNIIMHGEEFEMYTYLNVTADTMFFLGIGYELGGMSMTESLDEYAPLPINYGTEWSIMRYDTLGIFPWGTIVEAETVRVSIDGWGTIEVPEGTHQCLRLRSNWFTIENVIDNNIIIDSDTSYGTSFSWLSKTSMDVASFNYDSESGELDLTQADDVTIMVTPTAIEEKSSITNNFTLKQNYPNPFNPRTVISWQLAVGSDVELSVYNLLGQRVATLVSERQQPGFHQVDWNAGHLSSGVYYYLIHAGEFQEKKKMVLLR
jgi:hypothetical protein